MCALVCVSVSECVYKIELLESMITSLFILFLKVFNYGGAGTCVGSSLVVVRRLLIAVASLVAERRL